MLTSLILPSPFQTLWLFKCVCYIYCIHFFTQIWSKVDKPTTIKTISLIQYFYWNQKYESSLHWCSNNKEPLVGPPISCPSHTWSPCLSCLVTVHSPVGQRVGQNDVVVRYLFHVPVHIAINQQGKTCCLIDELMSALRDAPLLVWCPGDVAKVENSCCAVVLIDFASKSW